MNIDFRTFPYMLWIIISVQFIGGAYGLVDYMLDIRGFSLIYFFYLLLCVLGILSSLLIYYEKKIGYEIAFFNFVGQIPLIETSLISYEYYSLISINAYTGTIGTGFNLNFATLLKISLNDPITVWGVGVNFFALFIFYQLFKFYSSKFES